MHFNRATQSILTQLQLKDQPGLVPNVSRDEHWLEERCQDGKPADWCLEWTEIVVDAHGEVGNQDHYLFGVFADLATAIDAVMRNPSRSPDAIVELDISEWAFLYRAPTTLAAA